MISHPNSAVHSLAQALHQPHRAAGPVWVSPDHPPHRVTVRTAPLRHPLPAARRHHPEPWPEARQMERSRAGAAQEKGPRSCRHRPPGRREGGQRSSSAVRVSVIASRLLANDARLEVRARFPSSCSGCFFSFFYCSRRRFVVGNEGGGGAVWRWRDACRLRQQRRRRRTVPVVERCCPRRRTDGREVLQKGATAAAAFEGSRPHSLVEVSETTSGFSPYDGFSAIFGRRQPLCRADAKLLACGCFRQFECHKHFRFWVEKTQRMCGVERMVGRAD